MSGSAMLLLPCRGNLLLHVSCLRHQLMNFTTEEKPLESMCFVICFPN